MRKFNKFLLLGLIMLVLFPGTVQASLFTDVKDDEWYYPVLVSNQKNNIITGYPDGTFRPNNSISRAQVAQIINRVLKLPNSTNYQPSFIDVSSDHPAYQDIAALTKAGIFNNGRNFNPNDTLTRAQLSKIIVLINDFQVQQEVKSSFTDVLESHWANSYISFLAKAGITTGKTKTTFAPNNAVTRIQALVLLNRSMEYKKNPSTDETIYDPFEKVYKKIEQANESFISETIKLVNLERKKHGLTALVEDKMLSQIAFIKADDMILNNYFEHTSPIYGAPWDMADGFGYFYKTFGENIAHGYEESNEVVTAWMNSPGHRANILNSKYTTIGVGIALNESNQYYYVHMFSSK
ncbi:S-layer homology domain-containing protein [Psychrobacillus psychrotolerans]|uniref:CAP and S-layer homology domain-containing protein n=1 Tax=Psychrobacillus psychrotolerans TaxID=126156 RepID=UPI003B02DDF4